MLSSTLQDLLRDFFDLLSQGELAKCELLLTTYRPLLAEAEKPWIDYLTAIMLVEKSPPLWDLAEALLQQLLTLALSDELLPRVHLEIAFGADYLGDYYRALDHNRTSLDLFRRLGDQMYEAKVLKNIGIAHTRAFERGQAGRSVLQQALACHQASLALCQQLGDERLAATVEFELGTVYKALGRWEDALAQYAARAKKCRRFGWQRSLALTLDNMGEVYHHFGLLSEAEACYQEGLTGMAALPTPAPYEEADIWANLALTKQAQGQPEAALHASDRAIALVEGMRQPLGSEAARIGLLGARIHAYDRRVWLELQFDRPDEALTTLERAKSRTFVELLANRRQAADGHMLAAADIQARLPKDALLLEYFVTPDYACVFAVTAERITATPLAADLYNWLPRIFEPGQQRLLRLTPGPNQQLHDPWPIARLRSRLIEPVAALVGRYRQLIIAPHGLLHFVPFCALLPEDGLPIMQSPSATVLLDYCQSQLPGQGHGALVVSFGPDLKHSQAEAAAVAQRLGGIWLDGAAATCAAVLGEAGHVPILHFACHAHFDPRNPLISGLDLADGRLTAQAILEEMALQADLVVLSACETGRSKLHSGDELIGLARAFLAAGAPAVLVSLWPVDDISTRILMEKFYDRLLAGQMPARALQAAQHYLRDLTIDELRERLWAGGLPQQESAAQIERLQAVFCGPERQRPFAHPYYWAPFLLIGGRLQTQQC